MLAISPALYSFVQALAIADIGTAMHTSAERIGKKGKFGGHPFPSNFESLVGCIEGCSAAAERSSQSTRSLRRASFCTHKHREVTSQKKKRES